MNSGEFSLGVVPGRGALDSEADIKACRYISRKNTYTHTQIFTHNKDFLRTFIGHHTEETIGFLSITPADQGVEAMCRQSSHLLSKQLRRTRV